MQSSKAAIVISGVIAKVQLICGIAILFLFGIATIAALTDAELASDGFLPFCIVVDIIGIVLIIFSRRRHKLIADFRKYVAAISSDPTGSIANLAAAVGTSQDVVKKNLEIMIKRKYFANAYINHDTECIIIKSHTNTVPKSTSGNFEQAKQKQSMAPAPEVEYIALVCKNCGGMNRGVKGQVCECDFCSSPISQ